MNFPELRGKGVNLRMEFDQGDGFVSATCPQLNLCDHGETEEEAAARLSRSIWMFLRVCARRGTLLQVLKERNALSTGGDSGRTVQIPIASLLYETEGKEAK